MSYSQVHLWHMFLTGPLISYIGFKQDETPQLARNMLLALVLSLLFTVRLPSSKMDKRNIILLIHFLVWFPLFLYIALSNKNPNFVYHILKVLGIVAILYHSFKIYNLYLN